MRKLLLSFSLCCIISSSLQAQTLYGITFRGGSDAGGTIDKFDVVADTLSVQRSFQRSGANPYYTRLIQASNGKLYGVTFNGGGSSGGVIFSYDTAQSVYSKVYDFDITNGSKPSGSLLQASDGKLYGMATFGGTENSGVIFSFDITSNTYTKLYDFDQTSGANPSGSLIQANGLLYGMTPAGGANGTGVIFSFNITSKTFTKLKDFGTTEGAAPLGDFLLAGNGLLYATTANGGVNQSGVIFSYNTTTNTYTKLTDLDSANGNYPYGSLVQATNGKLYGLTFKGGSSNDGVIFSFNTTSSAYTKLHDLDSANGSDPYGNLLQASDGNLYGMTSQGGINNAGVLFSFNINSSLYTKVTSFDVVNGGVPYGSLLQTGSGKLYGLTFQGGSSNVGVAFSFDLTNSSYIKIKDFGTNINGRNVSGALVKASNGKLYGMTAFGGSLNKGVLFSFDPITTTYVPLASFDSTNGANPYGSLIQATDGNLYGMTLLGGSHNTGVIFSYDIASAAFTKLKDLDSISGMNPYGSLVQATNGKLYGMTYSGGPNNYGTIFSFDAATSAFTTVKYFDYLSGANPYGSLTQAADGKLYGVTYNGGNSYIAQADTTGAGVVFSFDPSTLVYTKIKEFDNDSSGGFPTGSFTKATDGKLYATASMGGTNGAGILFSFNPSNQAFANIYNFDYTNGLMPYGNLLQATDGKLYGSTYQGGLNNFGVIFSYDPSSLVFNKLIDFSDDNGANPFYGSAFIEVSQTGPLPVSIINFSGKNNNNENLLTWKVTNQQNLDHYELQRSFGPGNFITIGTIKAVTINTYNYDDNIVADTASSFFYRLKSVDIDGKYVYSKVIELRRDLFTKVSVFPNPFKNNITVIIHSAVNDNAVLTITNVVGRSLYKIEEKINKGTTTLNLTNLDNLSKGTYILTINSSVKSQSVTIIKGN